MNRILDGGFAVSIKCSWRILQTGAHSVAKQVCATMRRIQNEVRFCSMKVLNKVSHLYESILDNILRKGEYETSVVREYCSCALRPSAVSHVNFKFDIHHAKKITSVVCSTLFVLLHSKTHWKACGNAYRSFCKCASFSLIWLLQNHSHVREKHFPDRKKNMQLGLWIVLRRRNKKFLLSILLTDFQNLTAHHMSLFLDQIPYLTYSFQRLLSAEFCIETMLSYQLKTNLFRTKQCILRAWRTNISQNSSKALIFEKQYRISKGFTTSQPRHGLLSVPLGKFEILEVP